jgi:hypothetical protein
VSCPDIKKVHGYLNQLQNFAGVNLTNAQQHLTDFYADVKSSDGRGFPAASWIVPGIDVSEHPKLGAYSSVKWSQRPT